MAMPMNTAVKRVNTYACTSTTMHSRRSTPIASGSDITTPALMPVAAPPTSVNRKTSDRSYNSAMCPPVMFAASRIVSANGRTNMPMISIGMSRM